METEEIEMIGGLPVAHRPVPAWLLVFVVAVASVAVWYLLSFSSTPYQGGTKAPAPPAVSE